MKNISVAEKNILLFDGEEKNLPLVIFNSFEGEGEKVFSATKNLTKKNFSFASIEIKNWEDEMSPYQIPPLGKNNPPFTGGADIYLEQLTEKILPKILDNLKFPPSYFIIAGYSLAGLFAIYSMYKTNLFSRIVSASGSFWFPKFLDFAKKNNLQKIPDKIYFSLGDKESKTKNQILKTVEENTVALKNFYAESGIETIFELNPGNHFQNSAERTAKGISWILED